MTSIITLIFLIFINAFFAASEMALVSLNEMKVKREAENGNKKALLLYNLIREPSRFLSTIQIGITLAGFLASAFAADFFAHSVTIFLHNLGIPLSFHLLHTISVILITMILSYCTLVFGELVPKKIALQKAETIANLIVYPITWLFKICYPLVYLLTKSTNFVLRLLGIDPNKKEKEATEEDIRYLVDLGNKQGTILSDESEMIHNVFEFNDKKASDILTHRTEMQALPIDSTLKETVSLINEHKFTRYPVYKDSVDTIVGILHVKDLIEFIDEGNKKHFHLAHLIRKPHFVPESINVSTLFNKMQENNIHIVIVIDEYGGTEGLVTIEDVIEEIVGEIQSETSDEREIEIKQHSPNQYVVLGTTTLLKLKDVLNLHFPMSEADTLSGFLIEKIGYIPSSKDKPTIKIENISFEVLEVKENRIEKVLIKMKEKSKGDE